MAKWQGKRAIDYSKKVNVYMNLRTGLWSIQQSGIVCAQMKEVCLSDVTTSVNLKRFQKVFDGGKKTVHAWLRGYLVESTGFVLDESKRITYNPKKRADFHYKATGKTFESASKVLMIASDKRDGSHASYAE